MFNVKRRRSSLRSSSLKVCKGCYKLVHAERPLEVVIFDV